MATMIRKQVYIRPEDQRLLKRTAAALDVPESEVIRRGISLVAAQGEHKPDPMAVREMRKFLEKRARLATVPGKRNWTREDLYEDA